ncbi:hypothetical protein ACQEV2_10000 [Streptomyces sp. CA-251387]|uniref:hypothetical protein n=1 Tax=Streptomyces sp. CA-251387 TaxID=3240064 RepID=UPI003D9390A6
MATLGLSRSRPVTFAEAEVIIDEDGHGGADDNPDGLARVYVSPEVDGWTLVIGPWCDPCGSARSDEVLRLCGELSARYGRAQAYYYGMQGDGSAWLVTERGTVLRRYSETGEGEDALLTLGEPLPFESARREELGLPPTWDEATESDDDQDEWKWAAFDLAPGIAAALGVSPLTLTADTRVRGTGVLAITNAAVADRAADGGPRGPR